MIIGHQRILEFLNKSIVHQKLAHAYLFTGPENVGKRKVAGEFIKILTGQEIEKKFHPDVLIVEPKDVESKGVKKEKEITIDEARQIRRQISLFPYQSPYKVVLIDRADKMNKEAASALLKTLEEPSGRAILILITANPQSLLPTIVSRCQTIKFLPVPAKEIEKSLSSSFKFQVSGFKKIVRLSSGRPGLAIRYSEKPELLEAHHQVIKELQKIIQSDLNERYQEAEILSKDVISARQKFEQWLFYFRDLFLSAVGCQDLEITGFRSLSKERFGLGYSLHQIKNIIQAIKKTDWLLSQSSINARLALEVLMLEL